jgi:hypothetical protein
MFTQVAIVALGVFLIIRGTVSGDYVAIGLGVLIAAFAASTLYKLKTGR